MVWASVLPHFSIEFSKHFTNHHTTVVGSFGATEELTIKQGCILIAAIYGHDSFRWSLGFVHPLLEGIELGFAIFLVVSLIGIVYCFSNFFDGFKAAKDVTYAFKCLIPGV